MGVESSQRATKELVMVKPDIRLYAGESSVAYQAQFSLNLAFKSARSSHRLNLAVLRCNELVDKMSA